MSAGKALSVASIVISAISLAIGVWGSNGVMSVASLIALCFSIINVKYSPDRFRLALIMSVILLVCTVLITTIFSYETLVRDGTLAKDTWSYIAGVIQAIAVLPVAFMSYFAIAAFSNASYNWAVITGLTTFIGLGIHTAGYAMTYAFFIFDLEKGLSENSYVLYGLMIGMFSLIIFTIILNRIFLKNRYLITSNGLEVMP